MFIDYNFTQKVESAETEESVEEVREQLEKYKTKPLSQDKKDSASLPQKL